MQSLARQSAIGKKSFHRVPAVPQNMGMQSSVRQNIVMNQANANGIQSPMSPMSAGMGMQSPLGMKPSMQGMQSIVMQSNGMSQANGKPSSVKKPAKKPTGSKGEESDRQPPGKMVQKPSGHWEWVKD